MTNRRIRRMLTVLVAGGTTAIGLSAAGATPAQATVTPFTLRLTAMHSQKVLAESSPFSGTAVVQEAPSAFKNQKWRLNLISASTAQLVNEESGRCMEPEKPLEASIVRMQTCDDPNDISQPSAQIWMDHARLYNGQTVHQWSNLKSHMCLDVSGASQSSGGLVIQYTCHGGPNQLFKQSIVP